MCMHMPTHIHRHANTCYIYSCLLYYVHMYFSLLVDKPVSMMMNTGKKKTFLTGNQIQGVLCQFLRKMDLSE